jgi:hypothetical protein
MTRTFAQDYKNGLIAEERIKPILEINLGALTKLNPTHDFDFEGATCWVELKSRTNEKDKYDTTLLPYSKIVRASESEKKLYCVFEFSDGVYYLPYHKELFDTFEVKPFVRGWRSDYNDKPKPYIHIPTHLLRPISFLASDC